MTDFDKIILYTSWNKKCLVLLCGLKTELAAAKEWNTDLSLAYRKLSFNPVLTCYCVYVFIIK